MLLTQSAASKSHAERFAPWRRGVWRFTLPHSRAVIAGTTDRTGDLDSLRVPLRFARGVVQAEQVHGASVAAIESAAQPPASPIPGCDALLTQVPGLLLVIRTADCLPLIVWDPIQRVIGVAHVGWRGLVRHLPLRLVTMTQQMYRSRPEDLWVRIGPGIRACCYEVGGTFDPSFDPFLQEEGGRRTCDLVACARLQLQSAGVRRERIADAGECTACHARRWYSVRREGEQTGRLFSFIMMHP